ncbi:hypothetical protein UREG_03614 [Uncinocarpus reesii 1704]|uniref:Fatty acid desaturase domain-containing protein n=1 Tax=Uncinocarpus reesii (strain UAMH 1704) TaxID=336963 RepID=C4JLA6_UNCRE|nr:uncharacterized protein UREG_03614 [Uncinocarpus reesii 1704]EEP78768.1 hypothetical protein UREG_03614 [Uncinocarpus reesii 1704]
MSSTAIPKRMALHRQLTENSSVTSSVNVSPMESPRHSPSTTSLSSLASEALAEGPGKLVDTYGNTFELPDFTIKQIRDAIPAHCFERNGLRGLSYVFRDLLCLGTTFYIFHTYVTAENIPSTPVRAGLWALYTFVQGLFGTGIWVLAHECGHQSFSPSKVFNDTVGWILHSALLVPYFSWKISHGKHHKATGNMERDMVFVPKLREQYASRIGHLVHQLNEIMEETPIQAATNLILQQLFGWPMYLISNVTGHNNHESQREGRGKGKKNGMFGGVNHFNPSSPLYEAKDAKLIVLSDIGLLITGSVLYVLGNKFGWTNMLVWYFIPYLWVNHWLVWNFARGAAATIDREFGFIGRQLFHGIIETHVLHHYVSTIPFYNADEATEAIKGVMGKHYRSDTKDGSIGFIKSLWRSMRMCQWVEPSEGAQGEGKGVLFFRNRNGFGTRPLVVEPADGKAN